MYILYCHLHTLADDFSRTCDVNSSPVIAFTCNQNQLNVFIYILPFKLSEKCPDIRQNSPFSYDEISDIVFVLSVI